MTRIPDVDGAGPRRRRSRLARADGDRVPTSTTRAYDELRAAILSGELQPGAPLRTAALAERHGTSRTPVREALVMLENEGLVDLEPRRGAVVRGFATDDLVDLYELRVLVEPRAAELATERASTADLRRLRALLTAQEALRGIEPAALLRHVEINSAFHALIVELAGSDALLAAARAAKGIPHAFRSAFYRDDEQRRFSLACHREILAAIAAGSADRAGSAMRIHMLSARDYLIEVMRENRAD
jgi:DNA-binding GntR family transcriptional regulator